MNHHPTLDLRRALADGPPVLLDGALGTQLLASAFDLERDFLDVEDAPEVLNLTRPEQIRAVHESWFDAGCDLATTNTFMALPSVMADCGLEDRLEPLVRAAVDAARGAAEAWAEPDWPLGVLGGVGPGADLPSESGRTAAEVRADYDRLFGLQLAVGVDGLLIETCLDSIQVRAALEAARARFDGPLLLSLLPGGKAPGEALAAARDHAVDLLALNCGDGPEPMAQALAAIRDDWSGALGCWPNAGAVDPDGPAGPGPIEPEAFADQVAALVDRYGLRLVGGCCGTTPAHLRALAAALGRRPREDEPLEP